MNNCLVCKNTQSYVSIKFKNGKKTYNLNLCEDCCKNFNIIFKKRKKQKKQKCPFCGYTLREFKEYGFLGCDYCYEYFYDEVINYLNKTRINNFYKGKYPKKFQKEARIKKFFKLKGYLIDKISINGKEN
ncbi:MAG: hypothetical protein NC915_05565 [Candidatus Omnitrophica bacterium]|nr:hypothetical protein [Candidatus Omnitrophota bacterium]